MRTWRLGRCRATWASLGRNLSFQEKRASGGALVVFGLSIAFVFLILAAFYESWSLPFSVLLTVPVAVLGAFLGLMLRELNVDVYARIGIIMLVGLSAKNAILIVEFAKIRFDEGQELVEAALEGARLRLRPILMTSLAFILGCVPLWVAEGSGAVSRRILDTVVISGMLAATFIAVFLIPLVFVLIERLAAAGGGEPTSLRRRLRLRASNWGLVPRPLSFRVRGAPDGRGRLIHHRLGTFSVPGVGPRERVVDGSPPRPRARARKCLSSFGAGPSAGFAQASGMLFIALVPALMSLLLLAAALRVRPGVRASRALQARA